MSSFNDSLRTSSISSGDDFDNLSEVVRLFAPGTNKVLSRRHVHIPGRHGELVWVLRDQDVDKGLVQIEHGSDADAKGWLGIETVVDAAYDGKHQSRGLRSRRRLVFKEESREGVSWLKFHGVFELDEASAETGRRVFRRVATTAGCVGAEVTRRAFPSVAELAGATLEAALLDLVETASDKPKTVRVWPDSVLHVDLVDADSRQLVCSAEGLAERVVVPVRDVELGYFRLTPADGPAPRTRWLDPVKLSPKTAKRTSRSRAGEFDAPFSPAPEACGYPRWFAMGEHAEKYCIVDLDGGSAAESFPVVFTDKVPRGGWTEEHRTRKLVLKRMKSDRPFTMGSNRLECSLEHQVDLGCDYYIGLFPVTQEQYRLVTGKSPSQFREGTDAAVRPVENVSYKDVRGEVCGCEWPQSARVDGDSFMGILRARTGIANFDLPTAAQWEHACGRGKGGKDVAALAWSCQNAGGQTHPVGLLKANPHGLHDMRGNVWEWCLDWYEFKVRHGDDNGRGAVLEPAGVVFGEAREMRGGGWNVEPENCSPFDRGYSGPSLSYPFVGFRVCLAVNPRSVRIESPVVVGRDYFPNVEDLVDVEIPEGIRRIDDGVFRGARNLVWIKLPSTLEAIGAECFKDCAGLSEIFIPDSVKEIGEAAFEGCTALRFVRLSGGAEVLRNGLFRDCTALADVEIPEGVTGCEGGVFAGCTNLESVKFPCTLDHIVGRDGHAFLGSHLFTGCRSLKEVVLPEGVTTIGHGVFGQDNPIGRIVLPRTVTRLSASFLEDAAGTVEVVCDWEGRDWDSIEGYSWAAILGLHPEFAEHCRKWSEIDARFWTGILKRSPHLAAMCDKWEQFDARQWKELPFEQLDIPADFDFAAMVAGWGRLRPGTDKVDVLARLIRLGKVDTGVLDVSQWPALLVDHPGFADACPFATFGVEDWANLLKVRAEFADRCDWRSFAKVDWVKFLSICRSQYRRCPWLDSFTGTDWAEIGMDSGDADELSAYHDRLLAGLSERFHFIDRDSPLFLGLGDAGDDDLETYARVREMCRARLESDVGVRQLLEGTKGRNLVAVGQDAKLSACERPGEDAFYPDGWTGLNLLGSAWMELRDATALQAGADSVPFDAERHVLRVTRPVRLNYVVRTQVVTGRCPGIFGWGRIETEPRFTSPEENRLLVHPGLVFQCVGRNDDGTLQLMTDNRSVLRGAVEAANFPWSDDEDEEGDEEHFDGIAYFLAQESFLKDGSLAVAPKDGTVDVWDLPEHGYDSVNCRWEPFD